MKKNPIVSILIPIYGVEAYIERCARSLMEQSYDRCEFVFVNDCSLDNSIVILEKTLEDYPHRKGQVKIIHHNHNRGLGAARLTGVENSAGKYITFVDSDDWVEHDYVETLLSVAFNKNADLVISPTVSEDKTAVTVDVNSALYVRKLLMRRVSPHIWGNLILRETMMNHGIMPIEGIDMAEDFHFMTRYVSECNNAVKVNKLLYHYTPDNPESYTKRYNEKNIKSLIKAMDVVYNYLKQKKDSYGKLLNLSLLEFYKGLIIIGALDSDKKKDMFNQYIENSRKMTIDERVYQFFIKHGPMLIPKLFSFIYTQKYC